MSQPESREDDLTPHEVIEQLSTLITTLSEGGAPMTPGSVVRAAALAVPHAHHAAVTVLRAGRPARTIAASDELPPRVDTLQYELGEGPCLDAAGGPAVLIADDLGEDERWPTFGPRCVESIGVRSMLSVRLPVGGEEHAGINYYSPEVAAFADADVTMASVLVPLAALAVEAHLRESEHENLQKALQSSRQISTAVGILMSTHRVPQERAFELLRRASMDLNAKLSVVADEVTHTGALPSTPTSGSRAPRR